MSQEGEDELQICIWLEKKSIKGEGNAVLDVLPKKLEGQRKSENGEKPSRPE